MKRMRTRTRKKTILGKALLRPFASWVQVVDGGTLLGASFFQVSRRRDGSYRLRSGGEGRLHAVRCPGSLRPLHRLRKQRDSLAPGGAVEMEEE